MSAQVFKPCERCGHVPKMVHKGGDPGRVWVLDLNPSCELCMGFRIYGAVPADESRLPGLWNGFMPVSARMLKLRDDGKLAARQMGSGCGAMVREFKLDGTNVPRALESAYLHRGSSARKWLADLSKAPLAKLKAEVAKLFDEEFGCSILGCRCPRDTRSKGAVGNMKCCLPAYAASHPADKLDDETLAAVAGMVGCLDCDALGKHWYLEECDQCNCGRVDAHLKCYYLASEYRKRLKSRKESAK